MNEYPQLSVRVPPDVKTTLTAISAVERKTQWRIIIEAIDLYLAQMTPAGRNAVRKVVRTGTAGSGRGR